jgi:phthalate 4,5-cis-dihydrodiol dehydrogenase
VASPHQLHAQHAISAAQRGKHVLVEKPMALTLEDCAAMIDAAQRAKVQLIVGHSHSFDAPILRTRELIASGAYGAVRMITALNYTDFLTRPRRPEELDTAQGGGAVFNQAAHQVDIVRLLGGGRVRSVRAATGAWDSARPTEGAYSALLTFDGGAFASLTYGGYGHFDSDEFSGWVGEMGQAKEPYARKPQRFASAAEEAASKNARNYGGAAYQPPAAHDLAHQHFGTVIVGCERADLRPMPNGVMIYQNGAVRLDPLSPPVVPRAEVIDEIYDAVAHTKPPLHDGAWAMATLEVCLAMLQSAREGRDVTMSHQVAR